MEVRTCGVTCGTHRTDLLSRGNSGAFAYEYARKVTVDGPLAVAVVDHYIVAVAAAAAAVAAFAPVVNASRICGDNRAAVSRNNVAVHRTRDIYAAVVITSAL